MSLYARIAEEKLRSLRGQKGEIKFNDVTSVSYNCSDGVLKFVDSRGEEHRYYIDEIFLSKAEWYLRWQHPWMDIIWDTDRYRCDIRISGSTAYLILVVR